MPLMQDCVPLLFESTNRNTSAGTSLWLAFSHQRTARESASMRLCSTGHHEYTLLHLPETYPHSRASPIFVLWFAFSIIHKCGKVAKNGEAKCSQSCEHLGSCQATEHSVMKSSMLFECRPFPHYVHLAFTLHHVGKCSQAFPFYLSFFPIHLLH